MAGFIAWRQSLLEREAELFGADPVEVARQLAAALEAKGESQFLHASAESVGAGETAELPPDVAVVPWPVWTAVKAGMLLLTKDNARLRDEQMPGYRELQAKLVKANAAARSYRKRALVLGIATALLSAPWVFGFVYWIAGVITG